MIGLKQANGTNIPGFSAPVRPDRSYTRRRTPRVRETAFGDGYSQRKPVGINNIEEEYIISLVNRPQTELDDLNDFLDTQNGVDYFIFTIPNSNLSPQEEDIKVICSEWNVSYPQENVESFNMTLKRVYEP